MANQANVLDRTTPEIDRTGRPAAEFAHDTTAERVIAAADVNTVEGQEALARARVEQALGGGSEVAVEAQDTTVRQEVAIDEAAFSAIVMRGEALEQLRVSTVAQHSAQLN